MSEESRYIIGVDLGTTNSCVAYVDTHKLGGSKLLIQLFQIPQIVEAGVVKLAKTLPSFLYLAGNDEFDSRSLAASWDTHPKDYAVGTWAKEYGAKVPTRLIHSAKSWLATVRGSREEKILPFDSDEKIDKMSPQQVTSCYLSHIKNAWNAQVAKNDDDKRFEAQQIVLTVPASFDEVARALTIGAAEKAGLTHLTLLEEPQAAFYNFLSSNQSVFKQGDSVLVCDIGGGTTDFSLITVSRVDQQISFQRMAVGQHLLLGGDNMDAAIAHFLETRYGPKKQWQQLCFLARSAKEYLLEAGPGNSKSLWLAGSGSALVGGGEKLEIDYEDVESVLLDGFFGMHSFSAALCLKPKSGIRQMGLPYETEPSITKHLAQFLSKSGCSQKPSHLLFNGGASKPAIFQKRIQESLNLWFPDQEKTSILPSTSLDLAVAHGAAYYGAVKRGLGGIRIGGGSARAYYLKVDDRALTLFPRGAEEGTQYTSEHLFHLLPNTPVSFNLYSSHTRLDDEVGSFVPIEEEQMHLLPPIHTVCHFGSKAADKIPVRLTVFFTEIGTLEMKLDSVNTDHSWSLEFQLRLRSGEELQQSSARIDETFDTDHLLAAKQAIGDNFSLACAKKNGSIMPQLEKVLNTPRAQWSLSVLRGLFEPLMDELSKKSLSSVYESRWWNLAGFLMRPGSGYPLDDHRIKNLWKVILADFKQKKPEEVQIQQWICYRRIAFGLSAGQQKQLFNALMNQPIKKPGDYNYSEKLRTLASLELVDVPRKVKLGNTLIKKMKAGKALPCDYWALARIGARQLGFGSASYVVPQAQCVEWIETLLEMRGAGPKHLPFVLSLLAHKTDCREINIPEPIIQKVKAAYPEISSLETPFSHQEKERFFGDSLPSGVSILDSQF